MSDVAEAAFVKAGRATQAAQAAAWVASDANAPQLHPVVIARERQRVTELFRVGAHEDYAHLNTTASFSGTPEGVAMFYWFDKTLPRATRQAMVERLAYWCDKAKTDHGGMPVPLDTNWVTGVIEPGNNSQHALWAAKMFYDHYERYGDPQWLDRAREIADWVIANMAVGSTPNRRLRRHTSANAISIKTVASADVLLRLTAATGDGSYAAVYDEHLSWLEANARRFGLTWFNTNTDSDNPETVNYEDGWHANLEMVGGLLDAFDATGATRYYDLAERLFGTLLAVEWEWTFGACRDPMTSFQTAFLGRRLGRVGVSEAAYRHGLSLRLEDGGFHANTSLGLSNIFPHTYLLAALHYATPEQAHAPLPTPKFDAPLTLERSRSVAGEAFAGIGTVDVDHKFAVDGLRVLTGAGGATATVTAEVDLDDCAVVIPFTLNENLPAARGVLRLLDAASNNDIYLLLDTTSARLTTAARLAGSIQGQAFVVGNPWTAGRRFVLIARVQGGVIASQVVDVAAGLARKATATYATTLGSHAAATLTLGPVSAVASAPVTIGSVRVYSPAPPPEALGELARRLLTA